MARHLPRALLFALIAILVGRSLASAERPAVLVNPYVRGDGTALTIQEGIDMVDAGGKVIVLPGTYNEAVVIGKGLTLEAVGGATDPIIIAPPAPPTGPTVAIDVTTREPVTIRDATVQFVGVNMGIRGDGVVDVTVERVRMTAVNSLLNTGGFLVGVSQNAMTDPPHRDPARLTVAASFLDGTQEPTPPFRQVVGIRVQGDVDARLEGNMIRRTAACIVVFMRSDWAGVTNADILDNDLDECYPPARLGSLIVQAQFTPPTGTDPTAEGVIHIIGNTIRNTIGNTPGSCLPTTGIVQTFGTGRIERNRVLGVVQECAIDIGSRTRGAIWIGSLLASASPPDTVIRFNDIEGNHYAGLRVGSNITTPLNARCNWWGSASGPSGVGPGTGDAMLLHAGAATPDFTPWAVAPIAETEETTCDGGS